MYIGDIIKNFRATHKLTQEDFAKRCGFPATSNRRSRSGAVIVAQFESGKPLPNCDHARMPSLKTLRRFAKGMDIPLSTLVWMMEEE